MKSFCKHTAEYFIIGESVFLQDLINGRIGLYNIGSGRAETWNALARAAFLALDRPVNIEYIDMPESLRPKYQYYTKAEMGKLQALGYTAEATSLEEAIRD